MKKTIAIVGSLAVMSSLSFGQSVLSKNAVGYYKIDIKPGFNQLAYTWREVADNANPSRDVEELFASSSGLLNEGWVGGLSLATSDNLLLWDAGGQVFNQFFLYDSSGVYPNWDGKWVNFATGLIATDVVNRGEGFWVKHAGTGVTACVLGEVPADGTNNVTLESGFNLIGAQFSASLPINDLVRNDWSQLNGGLSLVGADNLLNWDACSQSFRQFFLYDSSGTHPNWDGKWVDFSSGLLATETLGVGKGSWVLNRDPGMKSWTEVQTYTYPKD